MRPIKLPILFTTVFLMFHTISPYLGVPEKVIIASWALSPLVVIWMVIRVLKDGIASQRTFEEYFYDDREIKRVDNKPRA